MATNPSLLRALKILTAPQARIEALAPSKKDPLLQLRRVLEKKNVVGVGISEKLVKGKPTGKQALTFYVAKKMPPEKLRGDAMVPPALPETVGGRTTVSTDVVEIGRLRLQLNVKRTPIQPGFSIGHRRVSAGTLGAVVSKGKARLLLSNNHVLANSNRGKSGDPVLYPAKDDGGKLATDVVAKLKTFHPLRRGGDFVNEVDCALAAPVRERLAEVLATIKNIGLPRAGKIVLKRGMKVVKVGRTTGKTTGRIKDVNFHFSVEYPGLGEVGFRNQVLCTPYTDGGDSGALVLDQRSRRAVGLHFAGADGGSVFNPIDAVLKALGVKLVTGR